SAEILLWLIPVLLVAEGGQETKSRPAREAVERLQFPFLPSTALSVSGSRGLPVGLSAARLRSSPENSLCPWLRCCLVGQSFQNRKPALFKMTLAASSIIGIYRLRRKSKYDIIILNSTAEGPLDVGSPVACTRQTLSVLMA